MTVPDDPAASYPPPPPARPDGRKFTIAAFVLAGLAVIIAPLILGVLAVVLGVVAHRKGDPLARWAIVAGVIGGIVGISLAIALSDQTDEALALL